jgi:hypothetical protein
MSIKYLKSVILNWTADEINVTVNDILFSGKWRMVQTSQHLRHGQFSQEFMWHGPVEFGWWLLEADTMSHALNMLVMIKRKVRFKHTDGIMFCNAAFWSFEVFASHHILDTVDFFVLQSSGLYSCVINP